MSSLSYISAPTKSQKDIVVMGVGGAGGNAVNHMFDLGIKGVEFMVCNTDRQALESSPIEKKIQLGSGHGAGNNPEKGKQLAIESLDDIMLELEESKARMIFITAGLGGGTGTGAAPIIAKAAKAKGMLTVAIVTLPFRGEGPVRMGQAQKGLEELKANSDSIVVIHNDNISKIYGSLPVIEAFHKADDILATTAKGISELITYNNFINVDLEDVRTTMTEKGLAIMGSARTSGEGKIDRAVSEALSSPLLNQQDIKGAKKILFNLSYATSSPVTFDEAIRVQDLIQARASVTPGGQEADIIWGGGPSDNLDDGEISLTVIATAFTKANANAEHAKKEEGATTKKGGFPAPAEEALVAPAEWNLPAGKYQDVENKLIEPAYFRRCMQLTGSAGTKSSAGDVLDQTGSRKESAPKPEDNTLF